MHSRDMEKREKIEIICHKCYACLCSTHSLRVPEEFLIGQAKSRINMTVPSLESSYDVYAVQLISFNIHK